MLGDHWSLRAVTRRAVILRAVALLAALVASLAVGAPAAAPADGTGPATAGDVTWTATLNGTDVDDVGAGTPLVLETDRPLEVTVRMTNGSSEPVRVEGLRLEGRVMGIAFFRFGAGIDVLLPPEEPVLRTVELRTTQLPGQAVGLMPTTLQVLGEGREVLSGKSFPVDVRGSLLSAYGIFGLAVLGLTVFLLAGLVVAIVRERLPANRWVRAVRFAAPGLGVGLTLTFFLSVTRLLTPDANLWLPLVAGCGAAAFLLGYFLPTPTAGPSTRATPHHRSPGRTWRLPEVATMPGQRRPHLPKLSSLRRR